MHKFAFMLKTYENDYIYAKRLLDSFVKYNADNIPCFVVLPKASKNFLIDRLNAEVREQCIFMDEESLPYQIDEDIGGIKAGYINQEIVKLSFWEQGLCENYCCLDSDAVIIREFHISDFMHDTDTPYSVLFEDSALRADPQYYKAYWIDRQKALDKIKKEMDFCDTKLLTCHGFQNFSCKVLKDFKENFMEKKGYSYRRLMEIAPYEFTWYNIWLQKSKTIAVYSCDEIFKTFHMKHHMQLAWMAGVELDDLARSYVGIVINSNYCGGKLVNYEDNRLKGILQLGVSAVKARVLRGDRKND